jgi:hypothetical protein
MKKVILLIALLSISVLSIAQIDVSFNVQFRYATTVQGCNVVNISLSYYAFDNSFAIDSDEAATISRYQVLRYKETKEETKVFTDGGIFTFKNGKGGFESCTFVNSSLDFKVVYSDFKMKALVSDRNLVFKK